MTAFPFLQLEGTPEEIGFRHGREAGDLIETCISYYRARFLREAGVTWEQACAIAREITASLRGYAPEMVAEMEGIARGAEQDFDAIVAVNARSEVFYSAKQREPVQNECTSGAVTGEASANGHTYVFQNWDQDMEIQKHLLMLEARVPGKPAILFLTEAGILARSGLNELGFGITGNALHSSRVLKEGFGVPISVIRREALWATSWEGAVSAVTRATRCHSGNHVIGSAEGRAVDLETAPDCVFALDPEEGVIAHSNHFLSQDPLALEIARRKDGKSSETRFACMNARLTGARGRIDDETIKAALADHDGGGCSVCRHIGTDEVEGVGTISSIIMDLTDRRMLAAAGPSCVNPYSEYRLS